MEQIRDLGVGWIRDDLYWSSVEKTKGEYRIPDFAWKWLKAAKENNLKVILILNGSNGKLYEDPFDRNGYVNFVKFVAREVRGYAHALEIVNEPFGHFRRIMPGQSDENSHWNGWNPVTGETDPWVMKYRELLNAAAEAIHETAPGEYKVLGLGCSIPVNLRLLEMGISPHVEGMTLHPYSYRLVPEIQPYGDTPGFRSRDGVVAGDRAGTSASIYRELSEVLRKREGPKEIWLTEVGYTTYIPIKPERYGGFTEEAQAKYAQRHFMESLGLGIRLISWYAFYSRQDSPLSNLGNFGLVRFDGSPKPAYHAIRRLTEAMRTYHADGWGEVRVHFRPLRHFTHRPDPQPLVWDGTRRATYGTPRAYTFADTDGTQRAIALWSTERAGGDLQPRIADLTVVTDRKADAVTALDLYSGEIKTLDFKQRGQLLRLEGVAVPDHPVLLVLEGVEAVPDATPPSRAIFDDSATWTPTRGKAVRGEWRTENGAGVLRVDTGGDGYLGAERPFEVTADAPCLSLRVRSSIKTTLLLRLKKGTGTVRQFKRFLVPSDQWEDIHINPLREVHQQWGAPTEGKTPLPAVSLFLGVEAPEQAGTIEFKDLLLLPE